MNHSDDRALALLRIGSGLPDAVFRDGQADAIRPVVEGRDRLLREELVGEFRVAVFAVEVHGEGLLRLQERVEAEEAEARTDLERGVGGRGAELDGSRHITAFQDIAVDAIDRIEE